MDRFGDELCRPGSELCLEPVLVVVEVERHHLEQTSEDIVQSSRSAIIVVHRRDQNERMADHDEVLRTIIFKILEADHTELAMLRQDRQLPRGFPLIENPTLETTIACPGPEFTKNCNVQIRRR